MGRKQENRRPTEGAPTSIQLERARLNAQAGCASALLVGMGSDRGIAGKAMKSVLFVCIENSCRSQMAEGFARALGEGRIEAASAGSRPSGVVNPKAIESMREIGIDISGHRSEGLDRAAARPWDFVITMGCGDACPHVPAARREDWTIPDPKSMPPAEFARVRDEIRRRIEDLLHESET